MALGGIPQIAQQETTSTRTRELRVNATNYAYRGQLFVEYIILLFH